LTIDYKEDLELINVIEKEFNFCENKFDVEKVIDFLEKNEAINKINSHCQKNIF
jgi:spore coat polysaccharide biosynthesis protein SpsF (cytidylyltransferase family)